MNNFWKFLGYEVEQNDVEGYQKLQESINAKYNYLKTLKEGMNNLKNYLVEWSKKFSSLKEKISTFEHPLEFQKIDNIIDAIYSKMNKIINNDKELIETLINDVFAKYVNKFEEEKKIYEEFKKINKKLKEERINLNKSKDEYMSSGKDVEEQIKNFVKNKTDIDNLINSDNNYELNNIGYKYKTALTSYKKKVNKMKEIIASYNENQNKLVQNLQIIENEDDIFLSKLIEISHKSLEENEKIISTYLPIITSTKENNDKNNLKALIKDSVRNKVDEPDIKFINYQSQIDIIKSKNEDEFNTLSYVAQIFNKFVDTNIFKDFDKKKEKKNFEICKIIKDLFDDKIIIDEKNTKHFLEKLKDKTVHKSVFIMLSNLRTNSRFQKSKALIELLAKCFNYLIDNVEKDKLFDYMKNCIILAQTYFYVEEGKKDKIYLIELIKNCSYVKNSNFWRTFIESTIVDEINRFKSTNPLLKLEGESKEVKENIIKQKLNEVVFSQVLPYIHNMFEFDIDKRIILKIADEIIEKYNYLNDEQKKNIYLLISTDEKEIEDLRKGYDPSLESEQFIVKEQKDNEEIKEEKNEGEEIKYDENDFSNTFNNKDDF